MAQLMQVRQVARTLGVHENTVRRWEERSLLRAVRLPSGVRRFRPDDVEAVRARSVRRLVAHERCLRTVPGLIESRSAISRVVSPSTTQESTSRSRGVRSAMNSR